MLACACAGVAVDSPGASEGGATARGGAAGEHAATQGGTPDAGAAAQGDITSDGGAAAQGGMAGDGGMGGEGPAAQGGMAGDGGTRGEEAGSAGTVSETLRLDCSDQASAGSTGAAVPDFCAGAKTCTGVVDLAELSAKELTILLPPAAAQDPVACDGALLACTGVEGALGSRAGSVNQLRITWPTSWTETLGPMGWSETRALRIETDSQRTYSLRVSKNLPAGIGDSCYQQKACFYLPDSSIIHELVVLSKPNAPSGWVRIQLDAPMACQ